MQEKYREEDEGNLYLVGDVIKMTFKEGEKTGEKCPQCGSDLIYYMGFRDTFCHQNGHSTEDFPMIICEKGVYDKCSYDEDYADPEGAEEEAQAELDLEDKMIKRD